MIRKNNRLFYNLAGSARYILPRPTFLRDKILRDVQNRPDWDYICARVNYYNRLGARDSGFKTARDSKDFLKDLELKTAQDSIDSKLDSRFTPHTPHLAPFRIKNFPFPRKQTVYYFDAFEIARYFDGDLLMRLECGDVNYFLSEPCVTKSRPIARTPQSLALSANSCILNLEKIRHMLFIRDPFSFNAKDNTIFFRGGAYQPHRQRFFEKYFNHPRCDLGHSGKIESANLALWKKPTASLKEHLRHKFIVSLEGNDVATNLKWIMSSNSLAISPPLKFETWFMEGRLRGDYHYIEIDENYENLCDKVDFYIKNEDAALKIVRHANEYCAQFFDKKRELIIALLVLEKYLRFVNDGAQVLNGAQVSSEAQAAQNLDESAQGANSANKGAH